MKAVLMIVIKTPALTGNNYKILLLVIIPTIQLQRQCTICHARQSVSASVTDLSRFQKSLSLLLSGEKKDTIPSLRHITHTGSILLLAHLFSGKGIYLLQATGSVVLHFLLVFFVGSLFLALQPSGSVSLLFNHVYRNKKVSEIF